MWQGKCSFWVRSKSALVPLQLFNGATDLPELPSLVAKPWLSIKSPCLKG